MQVTPQIQIQTVIKAMMEDVLPALDQNDQLAQQSAQLTIGTLTLLAQHLPLEYRYQVDELNRLKGLADDLQGQAQGGDKTQSCVTELKKAAATAADVLERARAEPGEINEAIRGLRAVASDTVKAVYAEGTEDTQTTVEQTVLSMSEAQLLRDRSWLLMQGWEPNPDSVPAIDTLLAPVGK